MSRRSFVAGSLAGLSVAALARRGLTAAAPPDVADVSGKEHGAMVRAAVAALGGISRFVKKGDVVLIKANISWAAPPEWAVTTQPATLVAIAELCRDAGAKKVSVIDYTIKDARQCLQRTGVGAALAKLSGVSLELIGADVDFAAVPVPRGKVLRDTAVAKLVQRADVLINVPIAKHHGGTGVSFGLKNHMGLIKDRRALHGDDLSQAVADLATVITSHLTIVDGTRALVSNGPAGPGDVVTPGRMIAGGNVVSVDAYALGLAKWGGESMTPSQGARHIGLAAAHGLGEADVGKLRVTKVQL